MALTQEEIRQQVGDDLGIVRLGTATSLDAATAVQLNDTSDDSPFDPGDSATKYDGAGLLIIDSDADRFYRQNLTYVPASQRVTWSVATAAITDSTPDYELHLEPFLHPLIDWPKLINRALKVVRRISWEYILLTGNRGYYDLTDWGNIDGVEQIRRLYYAGPNKLLNADFSNWSDAVPDDWTLTATAVARAAVVNYPHGVDLDTDGDGLQQDINSPSADKRFLGAVLCTPGSGATVTLTLATLVSGGGAERTVTATSSGTATQQLSAEIEITQRTATLRFTVSTAGGTATFWAPVVFDLSSGSRQQIKPMTTLIANDVVRLFIPKKAGVGQFALLRPYDDLSAATDSTTAPDELIKAAVAVQVLDYLSTHSSIPSGAQETYKEQLATAADRFRARSREHMRKLAKSQQLWEAGELTSSGLALRRSR